MITERQFAIEVIRRLHEAGYTAYFAGGCVRDELLGLEPADYDVATDAKPEQVQPLFRRTIAVGASFGVIEVIGPRDVDGEHLKVQVATFRSDGEYSDGRRPDSVRYSSPKEDAQRRDFTINGMFFDPIENRLIDYVGGQADLQAKILRAIGNAAERFEEDKLRMLRAVRMAIRFDLSFDQATFRSIQAMASQIHVISVERIAEELRKILAHPRRRQALELMEQLGLLLEIFPEVSEMQGLPQGLPVAPRGDLWQHVLEVLGLLDSSLTEGSEQVSFPLAFATLFHDVGKRRTLGRTPDKYTFYHHEFVSKDMVDKVCLRLKLSNAERERINWLVEKHQYLADATTMRNSRLFPVLVHPGIQELLALHRADAIASERSTEHVDFCNRLMQTTPLEILNPDPLITGEDLIAMEIPAGPIYKTLLQQVREDQLDGKLVSSDQARNWVKRKVVAS
jgi:poly(A) polymerase